MLLLATDLDRTLLPNGPEPESPAARPLFTRLVARDDVRLVYVTGRDPGLVREAAQEFSLPEPDHLITDVGTRLLDAKGRAWEEDKGWAERLRESWRGHTAARLEPMLTDLSGLTLQEQEKQAPFKLSFYAPPATGETLVPAVRQRLEGQGLKASLIWSVDETTGTGLLDVVPPGASKLTALRHLLERMRLEPAECVFAGDSGNDLAVLTSEIPGVLVANATDEVRTAALEGAAAHGQWDRLYCARGGWLGMNGNYAAGILEGVAYYQPALGDWLERVVAETG